MNDLFAPGIGGTLSQFGILIPAGMDAADFLSFVNGAQFGVEVAVTTDYTYEQVITEQPIPELDWEEGKRRWAALPASFQQGFKEAFVKTREAIAYQQAARVD